MSKYFLVIISLFLLFIVSCADSPSPKFNFDVQNSKCTLDTTNVCSCPDGESGLQVCGDNGQWGECECRDARVGGEDLASDVQTTDEVSTANDSEIREIEVTTENDSEISEIIDADVKNELDTQDVEIANDIKPDDGMVTPDDVYPDDGFVGRETDLGTECPGGVGCDCKYNSECYSGFCIETATGHECAGFCDDNSSCGDGYECTGVENTGGDPVNICVYKFPKLCMPCKTDVNCATKYANSDSLCVAWVPELDNQGNETGEYKPGYGIEGAFCGVPCQTDIDCEKGYFCHVIESVSGQMSRQCVLKTGSCGCTDKAATLQSIGTCYNRNDFGTCKGVQQCDANGEMSNCTAKNPKAEICNKQDDNCNGEVDEGFNLQTDSKNCGQCATMCLNPHGRTSCVDGHCKPVCNAGSWDCDGNKNNGCETDLSAVNTCGACSITSDCPEGFMCSKGQCVKQYPDGHKCDNSEVCVGGFCTDEGICCSQACDGPCQSCATGTCKPVARDGQPETPTACNGMLCDGAGACLTSCQNHWDCLGSYFCETNTGDPDHQTCKPDLDMGGNCTQNGSQACKSGFCADGVCCNSSCDGTCKHCGAQGFCVSVINTEDADTCRGDHQCNANGQCLLKTGSLCTQGSDCLSGFCTDGVCCATACDGICQVCTANGCQAVKGQDDPPKCTDTHTCDTNGNCVPKSGQPCNTDSDCAAGTSDRKCKADYDGTGKWCGVNNKCFHDGLAYNSGDFSAGCWDGTSQAHCVNGTWEQVNCGKSDCEGSCGTGFNSCQYHEKTCESGQCRDKPINLDGSKQYCETCGLHWNVGGDAAIATCCGDDNQEYYLTCDDSSSNGDCGSDTKACCKAQNDCVDHAGNCDATGGCYNFGTSGQKSFCDAGTWKDPDDNKDFCEARGCGYTWLANASGTNSKCCGDDPGEDFVQTDGAYRKCCYNGQTMKSLQVAGSILCYNGELYDCNNQATDDSNISIVKNTCDPLGGLYCNSDNTWKNTAENYCECTSDSACASGHCKPDYDGSGNWCADASQCMHNASPYESGEFAEDCYSNSERIECVDGYWTPQSCGSNTTCATYSCDDGQCNTSYKDNTTLCDSTFNCSTAPGNDNYAQGGDYKCQGYCDGSGNCDFARNCTNCADIFPNAAGSCTSGSCSMGACDPGYANCDNDLKNGCEVLLDNNPPSSSVTGLNDICGDDGCKTGDSKKGLGEKLYKIKVKDCTPNMDKLKFAATLHSPPNTNYDLYLYNSKGSLIDKSTTNGDETVNTSWNDNARNNSRTLYIEIRYKSGSGCGKWTLTTSGGC